MAWVRLDIPSDRDLADVIAALVYAETGRGASVIESSDSCVVQAWVPEEWRQDAGNRLRERLQRAGPPVARAAKFITETRVEDDDWSLGWRRHFVPFRVGKRFVVKPTWESWPPPGESSIAAASDLIIELDPGGAFGTGTHASTQLALRAIEEFVTAGDAVVDVGCGSGILSLAALLLGCRRVVAIDFDPAAVQCARQNLQRQPLSRRASVLVADALSALKGSWDVIVANITAESVVALGRDVVEHLALRGRYIVSGFLATELERVRGSLEQMGLHTLRTDTLDEWAALTLTRWEEARR